MSNELVLAKMKALAGIEEMEEDDTTRWAEDMEESIEGGGAVLEGLTQDQFVKMMNWARGMSWDIPGALWMVCADDPIDRKKYPDFDLFPMHRNPQPYWDDLNPWPDVDVHFLEAHNLDLKDARIDWNFDT